MFRQADVERAIRGVERRGLRVEAVEIAPGGAIRILTSRPDPGVPLNDNAGWVEIAGETEDPRRAERA